MTRFFRLLALLGISSLSSAAFAHAKLTHAEPAAGATVSAPKEITLRFDERLTAAFSTLTVNNAAGAPVDAIKGKVDPEDGTVIKAALPPLVSGSYEVEWKAVGPDGHVRKGDYTFTVK